MLKYLILSLALICSTAYATNCKEVDTLEEIIRCYQHREKHHKEGLIFEGILSILPKDKALRLKQRQKDSKRLIEEQRRIRRKADLLVDKIKQK